MGAVPEVLLNTNPVNPLRVELAVSRIKELGRVLVPIVNVPVPVSFPFSVKLKIEASLV